MVTTVVRPDTTVITKEEKVIVCRALNIVQLNWQAARSAGTLIIIFFRSLYNFNLPPEKDLD